MDPSSSSADVGTLFAGSFLVIMLIGLVVFIFSIIIYWNIASKAGYSGALSLLLLIPFVNIIIIIIFAFSKWPVLQELERLRAQLGAQYPPQGPQNPGGPYPPYR
jgi:amino acid transporter